MKAHAFINLESLFLRCFEGRSNLTFLFRTLICKSSENIACLRKADIITFTSKIRKNSLSFRAEEVIDQVSRDCGLAGTGCTHNPQDTILASALPHVVLPVSEFLHFVDPLQSTGDSIAS